MNSIQYITDPSDRTCRFCGKKYPEVKFKKKAHAISELLGNKEFVLRNECDDCNAKFGDMLENDLGNYLGLSRTLSQIRGKRGVPKYRSKDKKKRVEFDHERGIIINEMIDGIKDSINSINSDCIEIIGNKLILHAIREPYTPLAVYKAFVKMALSLLPYKYMHNFIDVVTWLQEQSHTITRFHEMGQYGMIIERFIPGLPLLPMRVIGFIRKNDTINLPYYQFYLEFASFSYQMVIPSPIKDQNLKGDIELVAVLGGDEELAISEWLSQGETENCELKFYESERQKKFGHAVVNFKDLRSSDKVIDEPVDLVMGFEKCEAVTSCAGTSIDDMLKMESNK